MFTYNDFHNWSLDVYNIIIDLNISLKNARRLSINTNEQDKKILRYGFFRHHYFQLRFIMVIQLCKLLSYKSNEKLSYIKLLNIIENEKLDNIFLDVLNNNLREKKESTVKSREELISNAKFISVSLEELETLINLSSKIYNDIFGLVDGVEIGFSHVSGWEVDNIIAQIAKGRELWQEKLNGL